MANNEVLDEQIIVESMEQLGLIQDILRPLTDLRPTNMCWIIKAAKCDKSKKNVNFLILLIEQ